MLHQQRYARPELTVFQSSATQKLKIHRLKLDGRNQACSTVEKSVSVQILIKNTSIFAFLNVMIPAQVWNQTFQTYDLITTPWSTKTVKDGPSSKKSSPQVRQKRTNWNINKSPNKWFFSTWNYQNSNYFLWATPDYECEKTIEKYFGWKHLYLWKKWSLHWWQKLNL